MSDPVKISVLICTYNRSQTLGPTIESVIAQKFPWSSNWEILIVDNNSRDETRQVVEGFQRQYPGRIRYVFEPQQGISHARNAGIREAQGEILVFIDDDETAEAGWLQNLTANLHSGEWAGAGGRVLPPSSFSPPNWLSINSPFASGPLASFDRGVNAARLVEPPFGANMAFRKEVFERLGGFRTDLGRAGKNLISNEDTEFGRRAMGAGLGLRYEPSSVTRHPVEENRLQKEYFLNWWFAKGRSDIRELGNHPHQKSVFGIPPRLLGSLARAAARWMVAVQASQRFGHKIELWNCAGQICEFYQQWLGARRNGKEHTRY
jgi:glycosyltransferase involved in cell wall biosynthesis